MERTWLHAIRREIGPMTARLYEQHSRVPLVPALGDYKLILPSWAIAELSAWRKIQREQLLKAGIRTDAVCTYPEGAPVLPDAMTLGFRALARAIGRPDVTFHGQWHTAASWALDSGASIKATQVMLGHGSAVTTLAIYGHKMPGSEKTTADKLQEVFSR